MKILVFDTETTGLPITKNPPVISTHQWPYIVQLSYILYDTTHNIVLDYSDNIIKLPEGISVTKESEKIHKISDEMCKTKGIELKRELVEFNKVLKQADLAIGHNIAFDRRMIIVECIRHKIHHNFLRNNKKKPEFCTMKNSVDLCKIIATGRNGNEYFKYPKLMELHNHLFNTIPSGLHNSMVDVLTCIRCYGKIKDDVDYFEISPNLKTLQILYS
jgi:DNA polymerase III epsilon subunit-like protein